MENNHQPCSTKISGACEEESVQEDTSSKVQILASKLDIF